MAFTYPAPKSTYEEYAQICRFKSPYTDVTGVQFKVKLPSSYLRADSTDYINFYCGLGGFECGVSTKIKKLVQVHGLNSTMYQEQEKTQEKEFSINSQQEKI